MARSDLKQSVYLDDVILHVCSWFEKDATDKFYQLLNIAAFDEVFTDRECARFLIRIEADGSAFRVSLYNDSEIAWHYITPGGYPYEETFERVFDFLTKLKPQAAEELCFHLDLFR